MARPTYRDLLARQDAPAGSSWGLFGADEQLGSIRNLTPARVRAGARLIRRGQRFNLDYPLSAFDPPLSPIRKLPQHHIFTRGESSHRDDYVDDFYLQATSHIDSLRHTRHPEHGFYNFTPDDAIVEGSGPIGVDAWARSGIAGRGILVDLVGYKKNHGESYDYRNGESFGVDLVHAALRAQGTRVRRGDIVLLHTGWAAFYLGLARREREALVTELRWPGLEQTHSTLAWLWDREISLVAADNVALESNPVVAGSEFPAPMRQGALHPTMIALLGLAVGELWNLQELADDCARDGVYSFFVSAKPLYLRGGVGTPANAMAIK